MTGMLAVLGFCAFFGLVIWIGRVQQKKALANLQALGGRLGLSVSGGQSVFGPGPAADGTQQGRQVRFWSYTTGSGKSRRNWVAAGVRPRADGGLSFELQPQGLGTKFMELFGVKEIQVGEKRFDDAWFVQTNQPEFLAAALVPEMREKLMQTIGPRTRPGSYKLEAGLVRYAEEGQFSDAELVTRLETRLPLLHDLADVAEVFAGTQAG
jgi:hypothetical protein